MLELNEVQQLVSDAAGKIGCLSTCKDRLEAFQMGLKSMALFMAPQVTLDAKISKTGRPKGSKNKNGVPADTQEEINAPAG